MKLFIVENRLQAISAFVEALEQASWSVYRFACGDASPADDVVVRRFLQEVCEQGPDVVVLDIGLTTKEEKRLDELHLGAKEVSEDSASGFRYCRALANERLGIPIVLLTGFEHGRVARTAMRCGADLTLLKKSKNKDLIRDIDALVQSRSPHDPRFYWPLRNDIKKLAMWKSESLEKALDRCFLNVSGVRRFGLFAASMCDVLGVLFHSSTDAEKKLVLQLVKGQLLLSSVDPRLRDHAKHTGNVFWTGYRLLHEVMELQQPELLAGCPPQLYSGGPFTSREQLLYSWTLAALFHDYGYVDERQNQLFELVSSLIPASVTTRADVRSEPSFSSNMRKLRDFAGDLFGHDHFLFHFIDEVAVSFGSEVVGRNPNDQKKALIDHGFLSAHRLLDMVFVDTLGPQNKNIVYHAALAMLFHNYIDILRKWKFPDKCGGKLTLTLRPVIEWLCRRRVIIVSRDKSRVSTPACMLVVLFVAMSLHAQQVKITPVTGESWLDHLGRRFGETAMGKSSGVYGPAAPPPSEWPPKRPELGVSENFTAQPTKLWGKDLYRMKCQACHGPNGTGAPPEINSVIDPVRATSAEMYLARMRKVGMDVAPADAQKLAKQAEGTLLKRLRVGGTDMPSPNPDLTEPEVRALYAYLRQLAGVPGAEKHQVQITEPPLRVGEHIAKSTCHICHGSVGANPNAAQLLNGRIPPLSVLTQRTSANEFVNKVINGSPIMEGSPAVPVRGHMPAFNYLPPDEIADVYLYLTKYPPQR